CVWISTGLRVMFPRCWPVCASERRKASLGALLWAVLILLAGLGAASSAPADTRKHGNGEIDTEHMFGFTEGSDTGEAGEKEPEPDSPGRFGKLGGAYNNVATALEAKYAPPWRRSPITTSREWTGSTIAARGRCSPSRSTRDTICSSASTRRSG